MISMFPPFSSLILVYDRKIISANLFGTKTNKACLFIFLSRTTFLPVIIKYCLLFPLTAQKKNLSHAHHSLEIRFSGKIWARIIECLDYKMVTMKIIAIIILCGEIKIHSSSSLVCLLCFTHRTR